MIHPSLQHLVVPIHTLHPDPRNARRHDARNLAAIKASLRKFGQRLPIVVQREGMIVRAGNGRLQCAKDLGWTEIAAVIVDETDVDAVAFAIADNRTAELATWDPAQIRALLQDYAAKDAQLRDELVELQDEIAPKSDPLFEREESPPVALRPEFSVLVKCRDEAQQRELLSDFDREGHWVRALVVGFANEELPPQRSKITPCRSGEREIVRHTAIARTPRVMQLEGLFDLPPAERSEHCWRVSLDFDRTWNVGLIVGPSGSGKSTVAREVFGDVLVDSWNWPADRSIVDGFPESLSIGEITGLLSSVGFSSPPGWLKPFGVLSNGEQFRVNLARTLAERPELCVVDEFTSVVDRTVAKIGSAAVAKAVRNTGRKFVAVSCHADIAEWLQPDWVLEMPGAKLTWRCLQRRPDLELAVFRTGKSAWDLFRAHHYLSHGLNPAARCFMAEVEGRPAAFTAVLHAPMPNGSGYWREHRTVCLPDFQGVGIGNALSELIAGVFAATGKRYRSTTSHPAMIRHRMKSPLWRLTRRPSLGNAGRNVQRVLTAKFRATAAIYRATASFLWRGPMRPEEAVRLGILE